jgi:hypothetical protein
MATDWAVVVIRVERAPAPPAADTTVLARIQVAIGDREPEIIGPVALSRTRLNATVESVLERIFSALEDDPFTFSDKPSEPNVSDY